MTPRRLHFTGLSILLCTLPLAIVAIQAPTASFVAPLGLATDAQFNGRVRRDCGGSGFVNGYHIIGFCDSTTSTLNYDLGLESVSSFAHNSFSYFGYNNQTNPANLYDFGSNDPLTGTGSFTSLFGAEGNESLVSTFAIWPSGNYIQSLDDKQAIGVMNCLDENDGSGLRPANQVFYNTLVAINVTNPKDNADQRHLTGGRIVDRLFYDSETLYGSFTLYKGADNYLYLFAISKSPTHGLGVARVPFPSLTDRSQYTYWDGTHWSTTQPSLYSPAANVLNFTSPASQQGPNTGEVFYSAHHDALMCVFTDGGVTGTFWYSYVEGGGGANPAGPWSVPQPLWTPPAPSLAECPTETWNYAGHAYPDWDPSGVTLLLSWSSCQSWIHMATVVWS